MFRGFSYVTKWSSYFCRYQPTNALNAVTSVTGVHVSDQMDGAYISTAIILLTDSFSCSGIFKINSICFFSYWRRTNPSLYSHAVELLESHTPLHTHTPHGWSSLTTAHRCTGGMASYLLHHLSGMWLQSEELEPIKESTCTQKFCQAIF